MTTQTAHAPKGGETPAFYMTEEYHPEGSTMLGFWIYIMSDCLIFAVLFATYAVLGHNYAAGPSPASSPSRAELAKRRVACSRTPAGNYGRFGPESARRCADAGPALDL